MQKKSLYPILSICLYLLVFIVSYNNLLPFLRIDPTKWPQNVIMLIASYLVIGLFDTIIYFLCGNKKSWLYLCFDFVIGIFAIIFMYLSSSYLPALIIPACLLIIFLKNSLFWNLYKTKNIFDLKQVNTLLLNENLNNYNKSITRVYACSTFTEHSFIHTHNGKDIVVLNKFDYEQNESYVTLLVLRLLSIGQTKNKIFGNNIGLAINSILVIFCFFMFDFNIGSLVQFISFCALFTLLNKLISILFFAIEKNFEIVYDILLYDQQIDKLLFRAFIAKKYADTNFAERQNTIETLEESQFSPYNTSKIINACHVGFWNLS